MQWSELDREPCSIARTLSVIGDRWTLLILRDCFLQGAPVRRFPGSSRHRPPDPGRPTGKLVDAVVLTKVAYQQNPTRHEYRLTQKGLDLYPVIMAIVHWGDVHMAGDAGRPLLHRHTALRARLRPGPGLLGMRRAARPAAGDGRAGAGSAERARHSAGGRGRFAAWRFALRTNSSSTSRSRSLPKNISSPTKNIGLPNTPRATASLVVAIRPSFTSAIADVVDEVLRAAGRRARARRERPPARPCSAPAPTCPRRPPRHRARTGRAAWPARRRASSAGC